MKTLEEFVLSKKNFIVAHRGSSGTVPENTMAAFKEALREKADMIEADIQLTADDKVIAIHDKTLDRTSSGRGLVSNKTFDDLNKLDAGSWHDPKFSGLRIPMLSEIIDLLKDTAYLNIELKNREGSDLTARIDKILEIIYDRNFEKYTLISSFDHKLLKSIKEIDENLHIIPIKIPNDERLPSEVCEQTNSAGFVCSVNEINDEINRDAKDYGIYLAVYSIDTDEDWNKIKDYDVKALVTNYPARMKKYTES